MQVVWVELVQVLLVVRPPLVLVQVPVPVGESVVLCDRKMSFKKMNCRCNCATTGMTS